MFTGKTKIIGLSLLFTAGLAGQEDIYSVENFYGGGVGFTQMLLFMDVGKLEGFEFLGTVTDTAGNPRGFGLNTDNFDSPFAVYGGEGFSNITGKWRIGGFAGFGSSLISGRAKISLFIDANSNGEFDLSEKAETYSGNNAPAIKAKFSILIGGATVEHVTPIFQGLEIALGGLMGIGKINLSISESSGTPYWESIFSSPFDLGDDGYVVVEDLNGDSVVNDTDIQLAQSELLFSTSSSAISMTSLTGSFITVQPYLAFKLQFLDRVGIRFTFGYQIGKVRQGRWILNNTQELGDSPSTKMNSPAVRAMIYFGL